MRIQQYLTLLLLPFAFGQKQLVLGVFNISSDDLYPALRLAPPPLINEFVSWWCDYFNAQGTFFPNKDVTIVPVFAPTCNALVLDYAKCIDSFNTLKDQNMTLMMGRLFSSEYADLLGSLASANGIPSLLKGYSETFFRDRNASLSASVGIVQEVTPVSAAGIVRWLQYLGVTRFASIGVEDPICNLELTNIRTAAADAGILNAETFMLPNWTRPVFNMSFPTWQRIAGSDYNFFWICQGRSNPALDIAKVVLATGLLQKGRIFAGGPSIPVTDAPAFLNETRKLGLMTGRLPYFTRILQVGPWWNQSEFATNKWYQIFLQNAPEPLRSIPIRTINSYVNHFDYFYLLLASVQRAVQQQNVSIDAILNRSWARPPNSLFNKLRRSLFYHETLDAMSDGTFLVDYGGVQNWVPSLLQVDYEQFLNVSNFANYIVVRVFPDSMVFPNKAVFDQSGSTTPPRMYPVTFTVSVFTDAAKQAGLGVFIALEILVAIVLVVLLIHRKNDVVRRSSPLFLVFMLVGIATAYVAFYLQFLDATPTLCMASDIIYHVSFNLMFVSLLVKTWRISKIFNNKEYKPVKMSNGLLSLPLALWMLIVAAYLIAWMRVTPTSLATYQWTQLSENNVVDTYQNVSCAFSQWNLGILLFELFMMSAGAWLAYQTSHVPDDWNESSFLAIATYNTLLISILVFFVRTSSQMTASFSAILWMVQITLIFFPVFLLLGVTKALFALKWLKPRKVNRMALKGSARTTEAAGLTTTLGAPSGPSTGNSVPSSQAASGPVRSGTPDASHPSTTIAST